MPELPEVEVTRLGLLPCLPGNKVIRVLSSRKRLREAIPVTLLKKHLTGHEISAIERRAKYLLFRVSNGGTMLLHLGMSGKLGYMPATEPVAKHDHLRLLFDNDMELRFNDSRRFGSILFWPADDAREQERIFSSRIGIEPLSRKFTSGYLLRQSSNRTIPVKNFLMDSRIIAGIGNIYANEILFAAAVHPQTPAGSVTAIQWQTIIRATRKILRQAIVAGGSSISDFLGTSGNPGYFQVHFKVYNKGGEACMQCLSPITRIKLGGRATYFCPACQPQ